jgi:hypothetical protein
MYSSRTDPAAEIEAIRTLGLSSDDAAAVLGGNIARVVPHSVAVDHDCGVPR